MVISHKRHFVYVGPPKTGSTTLHTWLRQYHLSYILWDGNEHTHHSMDIPSNLVGYYTFASVRNPYDRFLSLHFHYMRSKIELWYPKNLDEFFERLCELDVFYRWRLVDWLSNVKLDTTVKLEDLESIKLLPPIRPVAELLDPIPIIAKSENKEVLSETLADKLYAYYKDDFEQFGYEKNSWRRYERSRSADQDDHC